MYFQTIFNLYESSNDERKETIVKQLDSYISTNKLQDNFFQFLFEKMENPGSIQPSTAQSILNLSIDYVTSQSPAFTIKNVHHFAQYLIQLLSLKAQPLSYDKFTQFLKVCFRLTNQYNQETLFSSISKNPIDRSMIPLSVLCIQNSFFFPRVLKVIASSFSQYQKEQRLNIWSISLTNLLENADRYSGQVCSDQDLKTIVTMLDSSFSDKFLALHRKFHLFESALHYLPTEVSNKLISVHCIQLLCSVSVASSFDDVALALSFAKTVLAGIKKKSITNPTSEQLANCVFANVLPAYRSCQQINTTLSDFCSEIDEKMIQNKIESEIQNDDISLSTLFLISRYPTPETIPFLLSRAHVDQRSHYILIFYFLSHNLVPFRHLPRLFEILQSEDLHFLNEIFQSKPELYCSAAIKFLSQCRSIGKIEFLTQLFAGAPSLPIIASPYASSAFLVVTCLRAHSKTPKCPIRLLLDYLYTCLELYNGTKKAAHHHRTVEHKDGGSVNNQDNEEIAQDTELLEDNAGQKETDNSSKALTSSQEDGTEIEIKQIKTSEVSNDKQTKLVDKHKSKGHHHTLDLTNEDISLITGNETMEKYDVQTSLEELAKPSFCQSVAIRDWCSSDPNTKTLLINEALEKVKNGETIFTIILGSLSEDPVLIHNCVQTLAQCDLFLLTFFFTTAASCSPDLILKELREYINKEPDAAPQSFVSRLFTTRPSTIPRRQRIARRCIIGMAQHVPFSQQLCDTLIASLPTITPTDQTAANSPVKIKTGSSTALTSEAVLAVCGRLTEKQLLHPLLEKFIQKAEYLDPQLLAPALISILNANQTLTDADAKAVIKLWIKLLIDNKIPIDLHANINTKPMKDTSTKAEDFERVLLQNKNAQKHYLKEIEAAIRSNGDNPMLFGSLERTVSALPAFDLTKQESLLTLIIINSLSENETVFRFCTSLLRSTYQLNSMINPLKGIIFSHDYVESVRPFYSELAKKFSAKQLFMLTDAILINYKDKQPRNQQAFCLFTLFAVTSEPRIFVKSKFVGKLAEACEKLTRKNDYPVMLYLFRVYDSMNAAEPSIFFKDFLIAQDNEFVNLYTERYSRHSESLGALLIPRIVEYSQISKKWRDYMTFERICRLFNGFLKSFVRDTTAPDRVAGIIFSLLLQISVVNLIRKQGLRVDSYIYILEQTFNDFRSSTGISLTSSTPPKILLRNDLDFYEFIACFTQSFKYLQIESVEIMLNSVATLFKTLHNECALICISYYLSIVNFAQTEQNKELKNRAVDMLFTILKTSKFDSSLISFVLSVSPTAFSSSILKQLTPESLNQFLQLSLDTITKSTDPIPSLELLLGIIRSSTGAFLGSHVKEIMAALVNAVNSSKVSLSSILLLNIIGEMGRRKPDPTSLLNDSSVSFRSLTPILLSEDQEILSRVSAIFSLMIFGKTDSNPDFELIFSSMMSLYVGYKNDSSSFVSIGSDLLKAVDKLPKINKRVLNLLKNVFLPVLSVGDANCNVAIAEFLKFLKKLCSASDEEIFAEAIAMMTIFAKPKRK